MVSKWKKNLKLVNLLIGLNGNTNIQNFFYASASLLIFLNIWETGRSSVIQVMKLLWTESKRTDNEALRITRANDFACKLNI